jgi:hypothetical protein
MQTNVFGVVPAYGHLPTPAEERGLQRRRLLGTLRSAGEGLAVVALAALLLALRR